MRAVRYHEHGGPDVLRVDDVPAPEPGPDEVAVEVRAAAVNQVDTYYREGIDEGPPFPAIPGADVAGIVTAVGDGVDRFAAGDRVFATTLGRDRPGTCAEAVCAPVDRTAHLPDGVAFVEGAAVALVGTTAWRALVDRAGVEPAETVLVHGGSGGVGHVAVQLAAAAGARVVATARPTYHDRLETIGADVVLDYGRDDLAGAVRDADPPAVVLDHRLDEYLSLDATVAAQGGRVVGIGNEATDATVADVPAARGRELTLALTSVYNTPDLPAVLDRLGTLVAAGDVVPEIDRTVALDEVADAHRALDEESFFGKLVVEP